MDKREQEAILEAYKLARQQTARLANKNGTDPGLVEDAVHESILKCAQVQSADLTTRFSSFAVKKNRS